MQKIDHLVITATLRCLTGLRIGGSDDLLQIGGTDLTCIKNPVTLEPYIPGSSLKGKLRSELEKNMGRSSGGGKDPCGCAEIDCPICRLFGPHKQPHHNLGPTRIIVRDAKLLIGGQIETKTENTIDRRVGTASSPRKLERVVPESTFEINIGVQVWDLDNAFECLKETGWRALVKTIRLGMYLIEQTGMGAGTSRGYGQVIFEGVSASRPKIEFSPGEWMQSNEAVSTQD